MDRPWMSWVSAKGREASNKRRKERKPPIRVVALRLARELDIVTTRQVAEAAGVQPCAASNCLSGLAIAGVLERIRVGQYRLPGK